MQTHAPKRYFSHSILVMALLFVALQTTMRATQTNSHNLETGKALTGELRGGESTAYDLMLEGGQYVKAVVEQRGVDVVVKVMAPDGKQILEVDSPNGTQGPEPVAFISQMAGRYQLEIASLEKQAPPGKYEILVMESRPAVNKDRVLLEARKLEEQATARWNRSKFDEALTLAEKALNVKATEFDRDDFEMVVPLNILASVYQDKGDYAKAEPLFLRALAIREQKLGKTHIDVAKSLNVLGTMYREKGDYPKAEDFLRRALAIREQTLGQVHSHVATTMNNLAQVYRDQGEYGKAEPLYLRALEIREKTLSKNHPDVANSCNNLALFYYTKGDFAKAEPLYLRSLQIREKIFGKTHIEICTSLHNLALLYYVRGDYTKAESLFIRALEIREKTLGKTHPEVAYTLNSLGLLYYAQGDYGKAEPLFIRAIEIREVINKEHPTLATSLTNLAALYRDQGEYDKAESLYQRALAIRQKTLNRSHPDLAKSINSLALLYYAKGDYGKAESLYQQALAITEQALGFEHPETARILHNLANLYQISGDYRKAVEFQSRCNDSSDRDFARNLASGSERQKLLYLNRTAYYFDSTVSLHVQSAPRDVEAKQAALKALLQRKGRGLDAMADALADLRRYASADDRKLFDQLKELRSQLSALTLKGPGRDDNETYKSKIKALEEQIDRVEAEISFRSAEFRARSQSQAKPVSIAAVQKALPAKAALVEFALYRPFNPQAPVGERYGKPHYIAYVLFSNGRIYWRELGAADEVDSKIAALRTVLQQSKDATIRAKNFARVRQLARAVDRKVMQPIRRLLGATRRVFLSPDGSLNLLPFAALVDERGDYLVKRYSFTYLTSGRDLLRLQIRIPNKQVAEVIADPDFDNDTSNAPVTVGDKGQTSDSERSAERLLEREESSDGAVANLKLAGQKFALLKRLTGTSDEANEIKNMLPDARLLTKGEATETALKQISSPLILHIATHGFFLASDKDAGNATPGDARFRAIRRRNDEPNDETLAGIQTPSPLLRSGLFFAGANRGRSNKDDGILTALEAAGLDLWGTKLVIMSACDTGLGEVKNGDGVYGLRRALVLAGSESQMMSLWSVSDSGTRQLMVAYYKRLQAGQGRSEALRQVQLNMLTHSNLKHPYYWASFIQSGEWANLDGKR